MRWLLLLTALAMTADPLPAQMAAPVTKAAETITAEDVAHRIGVIAHDSMLGRDTPSRGLELTARYIADQFKKFGLKPGGDKRAAGEVGDASRQAAEGNRQVAEGNGTWFQRYPITIRTIRGADTVTSTASAPNTIGILEGSDPRLKHEYIVFSAHMDGLGVTPGQRPDSINNGADDDGSGTAGIIELAEAFSRPGARPRRSLIFLTVSGEEKGLLGSRYFSEHPTVPFMQIVANINIDMIGRNWPDTVVAIGKEHSDLGATLDRVSAAHPELKMTAIDDIWPEERFYFRSDHYNFARKGVPVLFFFTGVHEDYHRVTDSPDKINAEKEARLLRLIYYLGQEIGNAGQRPKWNPESYKAIVER